MINQTKIQQTQYVRPIVTNFGATSPEMNRLISENNRYRNLLPNMPTLPKQFMGEEYRYYKIKCIHCLQEALLGERVYHTRTCPIVVEGLEPFMEKPEESTAKAGTGKVNDLQSAIDFPRMEVDRARRNRFQAVLTELNAYMNNRENLTKEDAENLLSWFKSVVETELDQYCA